MRSCEHRVVRKRRGVYLSSEFRIANMKNKITEIDEHLRVRIRVIIWKQWKRYVRSVKAYKN